MNQLSDEQLIALLSERLLRKKKILQEEDALIQEIHLLSNKLRQAEALKSNFLSNIRNEVNNPLSSIVGLSGLLKDSKIGDPDKLKKTAAIIYQEAFNLEFQMRNIFAAADIEAGEIRPDTHQVNPLSVLNEVINAFQFKAKPKEIRILLAEARQDILLHTDAYMLNLILSNLISNAIEYSPYHSEVNISLEIVQQKLHFSVSDSGAGISVEDHKKIFERFRQLDEGATKQHNGQGLGLAVAREFAEAQNGYLNVRSFLNRGSTFTLILPGIEPDIKPSGEEDWNDVLFSNDLIV